MDKLKVKLNGTRKTSAGPIRHDLDLKGWHATSIRSAATYLELTIEMTKPRPPPCRKLLDCELAGEPRKSGTKTIHIRDLPHNSHYVDLKAKRQRFQCRGCGQLSVASIDGGLGPSFDPDHRMTKRLINYIKVQAAFRTFTEVGREVGVPETTIRVVCKKNDIKPNAEMQIEAPRVLGIDDKFINKSPCTVFVDLERKILLDIYNSTKMEDLVGFLRRLGDDVNKISIVCQDMSRGYRSFSETHLDRATLVIDKFHVVMKANDAVDRARKDIQKSLGDNNDKKSELAGLRKAFLSKRPKGLIKNLMKQWLRDYPHLRKTWEAKEKFFGFYEQETAQKAEEFFKRWESRLDPHIKSYFEDLRSCLSGENREAILNYFHVQKLNGGMSVTNGFLEALNLQIKRMEKKAPKYRFETIRRKLLQTYGPDKPGKRVFYREDVNGIVRNIKRNPKVRPQKTTSPTQPITQPRRPARVQESFPFSGAMKTGSAERSPDLSSESTVIIPPGAVQRL